MVGRFKLPSPGAAIGVVALVLAMGGAAYAGSGVGKTVTAGEIKKGAVTAPKLHEKAVRTAKIANGAVTGPKVKESTLGVVPTAFNALNTIGAVVRSDGTLARQKNGVTSSNKTGEGSYVVDFGGPVGACTFVASLGGTGSEPSGEVSTSLGTGNSIQVQTFNSSGNTADRAFSVIVNC
jgi:hypothetical protein